jgi:hypothetical protein
MTGTLASSRLRTLAQRAAPRDEAQERCELCSAPIPADHRHVLDRESRELVCACRACALLFDRDAAANGRYKTVPERRLAVFDLELDDVMWEELRLPVDIAFFVRSSATRRVEAFYPGPMGATESMLGLEAWEALEAANPLLGTLEDDVEALLVNRARGARRHWVVPMDDCFALVGLIRMHWRGFTGGKEVWEEIDRFFDGLDRRSRPATSNDRKEPTWQR